MNNNIFNATLNVIASHDCIACEHIVGVINPGVGGYVFYNWFSVGDVLTLEFTGAFSKQSMMAGCSLYKNGVAVADIIGYECINRFYTECVIH